VSPTAVAALASPITHRVRVGREEIEELNIIRKNVDVQKMVLDLAYLNGFNVDIRESVTAADVELSIDGAHELTITLRDTHRKLQRSGIFHYALDLHIEGWWWRLVRREKTGDDIKLTFEPRIVSYLRQHKAHKKARRGKVTRAEFILMLIRAVKKTRIEFYCPELHKNQDIKDFSRDEKTRLDNRDSGLDANYHITIQDHQYDSNQMKNLERVLDVGTKMRAFTIKDRLIYMAEEDLFRSKSLMTLTEGKNGVDWIDYDDDDRKEIKTCTVTCRMRMWDAPLATVVTVDNNCSADGKYLVTNLRRSYFTTNGEITLTKPQHSKPEPAPEIGTMSPGKGGSVKTKPIKGHSGLVYPLPIHGKDLGGVAAHKARPFGNWQSDNAVDIGVPRGTNVVAVGDGTIVRLGGSWDGTGLSNPNGYNVTLKTKDNEWFYTHMMHRANLRIGQPVQAGEFLGKSGAANGVNHLHIASMRGDPEKLLGV
jgi:murein DD-endopeptidase MepM/ murein hydrolase activator NlpD